MKGKEMSVKMKETAENELVANNEKERIPNSLVALCHFFPTERQTHTSSQNNREKRLVTNMHE